MKQLLLILSLLIALIYSSNSQIAFNLGGPGSDYGKDIAVDSEGEICVVGYFQGTVDFDPGPGTANKTAQGDPGNPASVDIFIAKYDSTGKFLWVKTFGSPAAEMPHSVYIDFYDDIYITGYFSGTVDFDPSGGVKNLNAGAGRNAFIAKYDYKGDLYWAVGLGDNEPPPYEANDLRYEDGFDVFADYDGNCFVTGTFNGTIDLDPSTPPDIFDTFTSVNGSRDIFVAQYDSLGAYVSGFALGGPGQDHGHGIRGDILGSIYIGGFFSSEIDLDPSDDVKLFNSQGGFDAFLIKLDFFGALEWAKTWGGPGNDQIRPGGLESDEIDYIITAGDFAATVDFDPNTGVVSRSSLGSGDAFLSKFNSEGSLEWVNTFGGPGLDAIHRVSLDRFGNIYSTGWFRGSVDFDPTAGVDVKAAKSGLSSSDVFLTKYAENGGYLWTRAFGGAEQDPGNEQIGTGVAIDFRDNPVITGRFSLSAELDDIAPITKINSNAGLDVFVIKYTSEGGIWNKNSAPAPDTLILLSPLGGENWLAGSSQQISWKANFSGNIRIEYSSNGGQNWTSLTAGSSSSPYTWILPLDTGSNFKVRILKAIDANVFDVSESFRIYKEEVPLEKKLIITYPQGGEVLKSKEQVRIRWINENVEKIKIEYFYNDYKFIASDITASLGEYLWTVPDFAGYLENIHIRISDVDSSQIFDISSDFDIEGTTGVFDDYPSFNLYPNPAKNILYFNSDAVALSASIIDQAGNETIVSTIELNQKRMIEVESFASGVYYLKINLNGKDYLKKFIIER